VPSSEPEQVVYFPDIFEARTETAAKRIILTSEGPGADTDTRWALETPYVLELIEAALHPNADMVVLDYGCGIGRIAKAMIEAWGCRVIGVDISQSMRQLAKDYVGSDRFSAASPQGFDQLVTDGLRVSAAISVWVLQHCFAPAEDIERIFQGLADNCSLFVLNMPKRAVPAVRIGATVQEGFGWGTDSIDVAALLRAKFKLEAEGEPNKPGIPNMADVGAYWMCLRREAR
jgi:SAM-dependent methyltransferase